ncbi:hypothetical protein AYP75_04580 [Ligilactobacillus agilis]|uniref:Uncharacterized protein n=1 Tax=Ligilactobacillus agilis TaxID=1601 RepID=A0A231QWS5_9LACO|nr:hypothetical protein AYP74_06980 [Ligilactobacillus agilis]OXC11291.1 hypothetical protein AYP75_04580 [Ligilactobacillus agilis]OXS40309.1 hypothetical protein AYP69_05260 [Ligilactobacillus agilis]OXS41751.1 hypothetical protein AYP70_02970 [Ligilactobacillus agilis]OXS48644.1 hypothetical protein AYP72_10050 [Ligilactobacillus agilis]
MPLIEVAALIDADSLALVEALSLALVEALSLSLVEADSLALLDGETEDSSLLLGNVLGLPFIEVAALVDAL